ncbi:PRC-barrel domain-containing protein [Streptomyces wuyuanensis]|uniref:PRC-barrel domain-containing protein n=1 Tax=Streptomyces wuyuanensis TaxID=1196353 RepID=UPI003793417B
MSESIWGYAQTSGHIADVDLTGYEVEATDGSIGKVDRYSNDVGSQYVVVDTGVWIFGKHILLPAGTVSRVELESHRIHVNLTKEQIKNAPEFDKDKHLGNAAYHHQIGGYYGRPVS